MPETPVSPNSHVGGQPIDPLMSDVFGWPNCRVSISDFRFLLVFAGQNNLFPAPRHPHLPTSPPPQLSLDTGRFPPLSSAPWNLTEGIELNI